MARTATPLAADRIRIEDEVWEEAFSSRVGSRPRRRSQTSARPLRVASTSPPGRAATGGPVRPIRAAEASVAVPAEPTLTTTSTPVPEGRRTVRIEGRGADRSLRYTPARHDRIGFSPDRLAMWAVLLGFLLVLVAMLSSQF